MKQGWGWVCLLGIAMGCSAGGGLPDGGIDADLIGRDGGSDRDAASPPDTGVDAGTDAGPVTQVGLCETCVVDAQCGDIARCGPLSGGENVCLRFCVPEFNDCPRGFECAAYAALDFENFCLPIGEQCCIDEDADGYGIGGQCEGPDCDDDDIARNPGALEVCDAADQDCDGNVDEAFTDCAEAGCVAGATGGTFQEVSAEGCASGACTPTEGTGCGDYSCSEGGEDGDVCATACAATGTDDDGFCAAPAHCDDGSCFPDFADGEVCDEDSDCGSGNCENGYCCGAGLTCCRADSDCPGFPGVGTVCTNPVDCEGSRGTVSCDTDSFSCVTLSGVDDDSACDSDVTALDCGTFADVVCSGEVDQPRPTCLGSCTGDSDCDATAHCDLAFCFPDLPDGEACDEASDCVSGHCENGFCCMGGDCCRGASDCPGSYGSPATCDDARACAGTRDAASCIDSICGTDDDVEDDSACTSAVVSDLCGLYPSVRCTGGVDQSSPMCAGMCMGDSDCDENAHCDGGVCELDRPNGQACDEASDCVANHCQNGFCCAGGDCCAEAMDCPSTTYARASECTSASTCQGSRRDPVCTPAFTCQLGGLTDDDSGCIGIESNDCGLFPSVSCSGSQNQTSNQAGRCDMSCASDAECDSGAFCNGANTCQSEGMMGDACSNSGQCGSGLNCVDGVCCTSSCTGGCEACNVAGSLGVCAAIPDGQDPANECGSVDCGNYFAGFSGDTCFERADAPASAVSCNGARSCQTASDVCPGQGLGSVRTVCDSVCEDPREASTCVGTTPPVCDAETLPDLTCGTGACYREVAACVSGSQNTCTPGPTSGETCNNVDDDCDGTADNNITGASVSRYEPNNSCTEVAVLPEVLTDGSSAERSNAENAQIYFSGDEDFFRVRVREAGSSDCILNCFDNEKSELTVTISVPEGAGSYQLCGVRTECGSFTNCVTVSGGESDTIVVNGRSRCCSGIFCESDNTEDFFLRVRGLASPGWECNSYTLSYSGDEAC